MRDKTFLMLIKENQYRIMPWKNGLGVTREIFIHPENATLSQNNFDYRLSSAQIQNDSPFSTFPQKKRWLIIYEGEGMKLNHEKLVRFQVKHFSGDEMILGSLLNGSVKDLGIIYDPKKVQVKMTLLEKSTELELKDKNVFFCVGKSVTLFGQKLNHEDSLVFDKKEQIEINLSSETKLIWIAITHV